MTVDISATFSKKERPRNGLDRIAKDLTAEPDTRRIIIGVVECIRTVTDHTSGNAETPVVKLVHIEPMDGDDAVAARALLEKAYHARTGSGAQDPLPFEKDDEPSDEGDGED